MRYLHHNMADDPSDPDHLVLRHRPSLLQDETQASFINECDSLFGVFTVWLRTYPTC